MLDNKKIIETIDMLWQLWHKSHNQITRDRLLDTIVYLQKEYVLIQFY